MTTDNSTILVKKADGTFVRMTLDELRQKQGGGKTSTPKSPAPVPVVPAAKPPQTKPSAQPTPRGTRADFIVPLPELEIR